MPNKPVVLVGAVPGKKRKRVSDTVLNYTTEPIQPMVPKVSKGCIKRLSGGNVGVCVSAVGFG